MFPEAASPMPPVTAAARSVMMSPKRLSVTIDVEALRVRDQEDRRRVDVQVVGGDLRVLPTDGVEDVLPQPAGVHKDVVLVHEGELLARTGRGPFVGIADHALHAVGGVHADLGGHLGRRARTQAAAVAGVRTLGPLAHHDEVDLWAAGQRRPRTGQQPGGPEVDVVLEREAQLEQQTALQHPGGHRRIAHGPEQDRVVFREGREFPVGQGLPRRMPSAGTEVVLPGLHLGAVRQDGAEDLEPLGHDLGADAVSGDHCEIHAARHVRDPTLVPWGDTPTSTIRDMCVTGAGRARLSARWHRRCPGGPGRAGERLRRFGGRCRERNGRRCDGRVDERSHPW